MHTVLGWSLLLQMLYIMWSFCVSVTRMCCAQMAEPIQMPFGSWLLVAQGTIYYMGVQIPHGKWQFWGLSGPLKSIVNLCCSVCSRRIVHSSIMACSKRDHSVVSNSTTAGLLQPTALFSTCWFYFTLLPMKNLYHPAMCPLVKICWALIYCIMLVGLFS